MAEPDSRKRPGPAIVPWIAVTVFAVVGVAIAMKIVDTLADGKMFAFMLELVFALLWLFVATAYWLELKGEKKR